MHWHHPKRGLISPAEFIPLAEETEAVVAMGKRSLVSHRNITFPRSRQYMRSGALLTYGADLSEIGKSVARYVDLMLKVTQPKRSPDPATGKVRTGNQPKSSQGVLDAPCPLRYWRAPTESLSRLPLLLPTQS